MDLRAMNAAMVAKVLAEPARPVTDGEYGLRVVETSGRASGEPRRVPLAVIQASGRRYLVSPVRDRDWVANLLAEPACAVLSASSRQSCRAEVPGDEEAAGIVAQYLASMSVPWAISAFPIAKDASLAEIRVNLPGMAVFRLRETGNA
ncbi:nitroreductase/quinone reductase family protein [Amycolatopsis sp. H20-H5]|uniref:nitroreductase/quinone reductase family protein n=1 Tax=Amycolatopsis sp. H20-H5 TaxID=3046309 RepID=UPI002DB5A96D|nr:nitroreductase/quinone reductase family protein [Amycolatopsis sp. H20-H5]MEC3979308.1 nitroreductase/quinone reductase family protein [Amycolatopsis sp. H20-H5]